MNWPALVAFAGLVGIDATSLLQVMISRPFVAATLTGVLVGRPAEGAVIGAVVEAFALVVLPIGAAKNPEAGTAAVAATAAYALADPLPFAAQPLLLAVVFALAWEQVTGATVIVQRWLNARRVDRVESAANPVRALERMHVTAIAVDFVRAAAVAVLGAVLGAPVIRYAGVRSAFDEHVLAGVLGLVITGMLAATLPLFGGWRETRYAVILGVVCGSMLLLVR